MWTDLRVAVVENAKGDRRKIQVSQFKNEIWAFEGGVAEQLQDNSETSINDLVGVNGYHLVEWRETML